MKDLIELQALQHQIYWIRGHRVMVDKDLASLYGVETKNLNKAVQRNRIRFPLDFMFQLTKEEQNSLRFQFGTLKRGKHPKYLTHVFTQEGVAMLSSVLRSKRAVLVNIAIMRAFVRVRHVLANDKELAERVERLEKKTDLHDTDIRLILQDIRKLLTAPEPDIPSKDIPKIRGFSKD